MTIGSLCPTLSQIVSSLRRKASDLAEPTLPPKRLGSSWKVGIVKQRLSKLPKLMQAEPPARLSTCFRNIAAYQFHDTSYESNFKKKWDVSDNRQLRSDGGNLAAVLYRLEQEDVKAYEDICRHIGRVLPGFDHFAIEEEYGKVLLRWKAKWTDKTFGAHVTSDGSLRAFALVTLLRMPARMLPDVVLLDEPELGLHPSAVGLIGNMIVSRSRERQIIVATQSARLVDSFDIDQIFVMDLEEGQTRCRKLGSRCLRQLA